MRSMLALTAAVVLTGAAEPKKPTVPTDIVNAAPPSAWRDIPADDLMLIDFQGGGQAIVQLAPLFAPVHVANIRAIAKGGWWDGTGAIYRVQDNYVTQWGNNESKKPFPKDVVEKPPHEYWRSIKGLGITPLGYRDAYTPAAGFAGGWPVAYNPRAGWASLPHCYSHVGVARDLAPDTGTGGELYTIIGHAPRQLDRNIAVVGRVIEGMERLSSLPRGTEALGFYKDRAQDKRIARVRMASQLPAAEQPKFEYLDTASASFAAYRRLRANRKDQFYERPAGGVDLCNVSVPVRRKTAR